MLDATCVHKGCQLAQMLTTQINLQADNRQLITEIESLRKAGYMESQGYALWCKPGAHPFGDDDLNRKRISTDDDNGNPVTYWMCSEHRPDFMQPGAKPKRSLKQILSEIDAAEISE